jgi:DNA-binding NtrC family response regulator
VAKVLEKISTLQDMQDWIEELSRLQVKLLYDFYAVVQDFTSRKLFPNWIGNLGSTRVEVSETGTPVLKKVIGSGRRSLVLYDLETPDLNGLQFLASIAQTASVKERTKTIIMAPKLPYPAQQKIKQLGAGAIIEKPASAEGLVTAFGEMGLQL